MNPRRILRGGMIAVTLLLPCAAQAQSVEYGALEQLFGEPVTVSATGKPQRLSEAPVNLEIITSDDIHRSGATNIPDVLRFVTGVNVRRYGSGDADVGIRGGNTPLNPRVLVLLDGRQVYQDDYNQTVWQLIPVGLEDIQQIEIIKGPNSALYGFNAVAGVINIVTYNPLYDAKNTVRVDGGSQNTARGETSFTFRDPGKLGVRVSAAGFRASEFTGNEAFTAHQQTHIDTISLDSRAQVTPSVEWDVLASAGEMETETFSDFGAYEPISYRSNSLRTRMMADTNLGLLQLDVYRNENTTREIDNAGSSRWREDVTVAQANDLVKLNATNTIRLGLEYRNNAISSLQSYSGRLSYQIAAVSTMWDWQITPALSMTNAFRFDALELTHQGGQFVAPGVTDGLYHPTSITEPSFNSGFVWKADENDTFRLTAARAVQIPSLVDLGYTRNSASTIVVGSPDLQPTSVLNFELDYDRALPFISSTLRTAIFDQRSDSLIGSALGSGFAFAPTGQLLLMAQNFGYSTEKGGELSLKGAANRWRWDLGYALAAVHDHTETSALTQAPSISLQRETPTHSVTAKLGYTIGKWDIDGAAKWQSHLDDYRVDFSGVPKYDQITVPNYVTANLRVAYRPIDQLTLAVTGQQLNSEKIVETAGLQMERSIIASATLRY